METKQRRNSNYNELLRYAGLGTQIFVTLGIAVFLGLKADKWLKLSTPLFVLILPLFALCGIFYQVWKESSKKKNKGDEK
jgi:ABC-type multidrug transport system permease subunit